MSCEENTLHIHSTKNGGFCQGENFVTGKFIARARKTAGAFAPAASLVQA
jgi:hypothetical protein